VLIIALRDPATSVRIIESVRRNFPHLKIFVRAWSRVEAYEYLAAGQERIYRDTLDSSLRMGSDVLRELGLDEAAAERAACHYRKRDEEMTRSMAKFRNDEKAYLDAAREAVRTLDELVRSDLAETPAPRQSAGEAPRH
jgi:voltage-gated potassium channel Kch